MNRNTVTVPHGVNPNAIEPLIGHLNQEQLQELAIALTYLQEQHHSRSMMPEQSLASALNKLSPPVRQVLSTISNTLDEGKQYPFDDRPLTPDDTIAQLGLDGEAVKAAKNSLNNEAIGAGLQARLGTDSDMPQKELSLREQLQAAVEHHNADR